MTLRFAGYAALFDQRDDGRDLIRKGAFERTLDQRQEPLPLFWQHQPDMRIGWVERIAEDAKGLRVIARIDNPDGGAAAALKQGMTNGLSFGYRARGYLRDGAGRELTDIDLYEVSLVSHPMQHAARVHMVERADERKANPRHYVENGRFARVGEGVLYGSGASAAGNSSHLGRANANRPARSASRDKPKTIATPKPTPSSNAASTALQHDANRNLTPDPELQRPMQVEVNKAEEGLAIYRRRGQAAFEEWARQPGGEGTYRTHAPDMVSLFRERSARFREAEEQILNQSIEGWIQDPVEHTLLVYRNSSPAKRNEFQFRILKGDPKTGMMPPFRDHATGKVLEFGQLPQLAGHELFIAEHVHPTPRRRVVGDRGFNGPSNSDLYHAYRNPRTFFIVRHVDRNGIFEGFQTSFSYFGPKK